MRKTSKNREKTRTWAHSHPILAQTERLRSSERVLSLKRAAFA